LSAQKESQLEGNADEWGLGKLVPLLREKDTAHGSRGGTKKKSTSTEGGDHRLREHINRLSYALNANGRRRIEKERRGGAKKQRG